MKVVDSSVIGTVVGTASVVSTVTMNVEVDGLSSVVVVETGVKNSVVDVDLVVESIVVIVGTSDEDSVTELVVE